MTTLTSITLILLAIVSFLGASTGFVILQPPHTSTNTLLFAKKKGGSMAEKRKRRAQARQQRKQAIEESVATLPKSKLDFKTPPPPPSPTRAPKEEGVEEQTKAKELVDAQRESVQMLTHITEQIDAKIKGGELTAALEGPAGYFVVDDFLEKDDVVQELQAESQSLFEQDEMTADVVLGTGEFVAGLQGGAEQYPKCPRSIEWVVSVTSKLAATLNSVEGSKELDERACSRAMARLFDRSALKASLKLLLLGEDEGLKLQEALDNLTPPAFQTVLDKEEAEVDLRKVSVSYFLVPDEWDVSCGGHLSFQKQDGNIHTIEAQRNRLVIWKSDTTLVRREPFRGSEDMTMASGLELHLVEKQQDQLK